MNKSKSLIFLFIAIMFLSSCVTWVDRPESALPINERYNGNLALARADFVTVLNEKRTESVTLPVPPNNLLIITEYKSSLGMLSAYVTPDPGTDIKYPAIIWLVGGFSNSPNSTAWKGAPAVFIEQGIVTMYPALRGGCDKIGYYECFLGEVDDIIAAANHLASLPYVDSDRIYLAGHSTGGTLALLAAESVGDLFRAVFSFGPVGYIKSYGENANYPFDVSNEDEMNIRSPILWLDSIQCKTFIIEGSREGNIESLMALRVANNNDNITFYSVKNYSHYSITDPGCSIIANKILDDMYDQCNISISNKDFSDWKP